MLPYSLSISLQCSWLPLSGQFIASSRYFLKICSWSKSFEHHRASGKPCMTLVAMLFCGSDLLLQTAEHNLEWEITVLPCTQLLTPCSQESVMPADFHCDI